ncbi:hypothetical protein PO909_031445 [Leuciscus waleckii]
MAQFLSTYFLVLISAQLVKSSGVFELKVHSFTTNNSSVCKQSRECKGFFRVCLNYTQDVLSYRLACSDGTGLTETFSTDQSSISTSAPITVPFNLKWPGTVSVIIEAWNTESSNNQSTENLNSMISHFATQRNLTIGEKWSQDVHLGEQSKLRFSYRVVCVEFFYGDDCSDFCLPRDDPFGHFNCDGAGNRICLPEWKGKYCAEAICSSGCGKKGQCEAPGQCHCLYGWKGPRCDECKLDRRCMHGTCTYPWQCTCDVGWHGPWCDKGQNVKSSGVFELKVHSFTTTNSSVCKQSRECKGFFRVCLNYTQDVLSYRLGCSDGTGLTETFSTDQSSISTGAPITVPFNLKWPGTVSVIIEAWNTESSNNQSTENLNSMISHFATQRNLTIGEKWSQDVHLGEQSKLRFSYRVVCVEFFYGDDCSDFCLPRDDPFGHFNCDAAGNRICLPEWKGKYCAEAICSSGCGKNGQCKAPGQCHCLYGWKGPRCDECKLDRRCMHGTCTYPWQCTCDVGWHGPWCDKGQNVKSSGVFELKVHSFTTTNSSVCKQSRECKGFFRVCLNYTQDVLSYRLACSDGTGLTETFSTDQSSISTGAPITVPFNLKWPGTVSVIIEAWNTESSNNQSTENLNSMISHFATQRNLTIGEKWSQDVHLGEQSKLRFSYRVVCVEFFYGDDCSDFCLPRDDPFGHFNCDSAGNRICLPEWKGKYCAEAICSSGCGKNGQCEAPGQCHCLYGWKGPRCDECKLDRRCMHGTCTYPWQCTCDVGWHGPWCDKGQNV